MLSHRHRRSARHRHRYPRRCRSRHEDDANAGTHNDLTFTDTNLRQGSTLDLTNTFTRDSQSLGVDYTLSGDLNVFGFDLAYNHTEGDVIANCGLPLTTDSCSDTKNITLFSFTPIDIGVAYLQVSFDANITTSANINGQRRHLPPHVGGGR